MTYLAGRTRRTGGLGQLIGRRPPERLGWTVDRRAGELCRRRQRLQWQRVGLEMPTAPKSVAQDLLQAATSAFHLEAVHVEGQHPLLEGLPQDLRRAPTTIRPRISSPISMTSYKPTRPCTRCRCTPCSPSPSSPRNAPICSGVKPLSMSVFSAPPPWRQLCTWRNTAADEPSRDDEVDSRRHQVRIHSRRNQAHHRGRRIARG